MSNRTNLTTPVGRIVMGSLYKANTTDAEGKPLVVKNGPNAGQPRVDFFFALAIPKQGEQSWAQTTWGQTIFGVGRAAFPQACQSPTFAWKIEDGDSQIPNKRGKKPCDNEGWRGCWILKFSGGYAPKVFRQDGSGYVQVTEADYVKPGYYVEVACSVDGNGSQSQPGIYLNHSMVCFRAYGPEIVFGPNVEEAGFGQAPLPAGASMTPPASSLPMPAAGAAPVPAASYAPAGGAMPLPGMVGAAPAAPIPVTPNPAFLQVPQAVPAAALPGVPAASPAPSAIPAAAVPASPIPPVPSASPSSGPQMTALANGVTYQAFIAAGWTDAMMIAQGYMTV